MHARVTPLDGDVADLDNGIANFHENVVPFGLENGDGAILLIDRQSGKAVAITLWRDEEALRASDGRANTLRADASQQMGAAREPVVERYEVAVFEVSGRDAT